MLEYLKKLAMVNMHSAYQSNKWSEGGVKSQVVYRKPPLTILYDHKHHERTIIFGE